MDRFARLKKIPVLVEVVLKLGIVEVCMYVFHQFRIVSGYYRLRLPIQELRADLLFRGGAPSKISGSASSSFIDEVGKITGGEFLLFSHLNIQCNQFPDWHYDYVHRVGMPSKIHCLSVSFSADVDPKCIWELSRFEWATKLARAWNLTGEEKYLQRLNSLSVDWLNNNPPNQGVNWYCAQECSIRLINLLLCNDMVGQQGSVAKFNTLVEVHCQRIQSTTGYGRSQNNNHGITEAAALYIGGIWLKENVGNREEYVRFIRVSRSMLLERVSKLIFADGGFSQYSTNYHRLLMDTLVQVEAWRAKLAIEPFPIDYYERVRLALGWLKSVCEPENGLAPNLGANDGARLFHLSDEPYEDFRPTIRLADYYFGVGVSFDAEAKEFAWNQKIKEINSSDTVRVSRVFSNFGLVALHNDAFDVFVRFANFEFRPSQADCLHVDLFVGGKNLLCDAGSYSYHDHEHLYFSGTGCHNTIVFDDRDQMPRVGKFLFGQWLEMDEVAAIETQGVSKSWVGQFTDTNGNCHRRQVLVDRDCLRVLDKIKGPFKSGTMNWHLGDSSWMLTDSGARSSSFDISVRTSGSTSIELGQGWRSRMYQHKELVAVLRVKLGPQSGDIVTTVKQLT